MFWIKSETTYYAECDACHLPFVFRTRSHAQRAFRKFGRMQLCVQCALDADPSRMGVNLRPRKERS